MAIRKRQPRRSTPGYLIVAGIVGAAIALTYGVVRAAGWLSPAAPLANSQPSREGKVAMPKSLVNLNAFDVVQREDVYDLARGDDSYFWLPKSQVDAHPEWIRSADDIIGRVMARDKRSDFVFSAKDFLPEGSRSGIAGGVPAGKQGFFLDAEQIPGLRFLKSGDRFDLLASAPEDSKDASSEYGLLMGGIKARGGKPIPLSGVRILVQNAEMIALTTSGKMTTQGGLELATTDSRGRVTSNEKDERVAIAIDPAEAVPLTRALGSKTDIHMVTRSGQESDEVADANILQGRIALPATAVAVDAFAPIKASDLAEPATGQLRQYFFQPDEVQAGWITQPEMLIGRVVRRQIEPGYIFSESDFLPPGSLIKDVTAYQRLSASDLVDGARSTLLGRVVARDLPAGLMLVEPSLLSAGSLTKDVEAYELLKPDALVDGGNSAWLGRVARCDLLAGTKLSEQKLLPPGSLPGFTAAIPGDRMGLTVDTKKISGAAELTRGDHCDLLASTAFDAKSALPGVQISPGLQSALQSQAINQVLATDAIVLQKSDDQVVLAVRPDEVTALAKAITVGTPVFCVARTTITAPAMAPTSVSAAKIPVGLVSDPNPMQQISISESLIGGNRKATAYRRTP
ncbi:MAG: hypothetical protein WBD20_01590 [Pirellulaceae bacterium]